MSNNHSLTLRGPRDRDVEFEFGLLGISAGGVPLAIQPTIRIGSMVAIGPMIPVRPLLPPRAPGGVWRPDAIGAGSLARPVNEPEASFATPMPSRVCDMGPSTSGVYNGIPFIVPTSVSCVNGLGSVIDRTCADPQTQRFRLHDALVPSLGSKQTMFIYIAGFCKTAKPPHGGYAFVFKSGLDGRESGVLERRPRAAWPLGRRTRRAHDQ